MSNYYVSGCIDDGESVSMCDDGAAQFWTLYHRNDDGLSEGIIDCMFREDAEAAMRVYEQRDALAAENVALRKAHPQPFGPLMMKALDAYSAKEDEIPEQGMMDAFFILRDSITITSQQTDEFLNSVRAEGADKVAAYHKERADALIAVDRRGANDHKVSYMAARDVAAQLRAAKDK